MELPVFNPTDIDKEVYRVNEVPGTCYYIPDFLNAEEEKYLLQKVYNAPKPKWTQLANRRLQNWGGHPHLKGMIAEDLPVWLQTYAKKIGKLGLFPDRVPNHVLINEYLPGQGIMPHVDGPVFFPIITTLNLGSHTVLDFYHSVASQPSLPSAGASSDTSFADVTDVNKELPSTGSSGSLESRFAFSLLLQPRSLVILKDDLYSKYLHGIKEVSSDQLTKDVANLKACGLEVGDVLQRETRVSLTIRLSQKTAKYKLNIFKT